MQKSTCACKGLVTNINARHGDDSYVSHFKAWASKSKEKRPSDVSWLSYVPKSIQAPC